MLSSRLSALWLSFTATIVSLPGSYAVCTSPSPCDLHSLAKAHKRFWGTCEKLGDASNTQYNTLAWDSDEVGMVTPINAWGSFRALEPYRGVFTFTPADNLITYYSLHMQCWLWARTLLQINDFPSWLTAGSWNQAAMTVIIQTHVNAVAEHYRRRFYAWTVVSEMFNEDGSWKPNIFYQYLGPNYVKIALDTARYAEPLAKLYIEEHNCEALSGKSQALYTLAQSLKSSGAPLDGIGFEGHVVAGKLPDLGSIKSNVARFEALGLNWAYTQLGVRIVHGAVTTSRQTDDYLAMLSVCLNSARCEGIITSGITDAITVEGDGIWGSPPWTETLFGPSYLPVPAYYAIADSLSLVTVDGVFSG